MDMILILKLISYSHVLRNMRHYLNRAIEANHNKSDIDKLNDFFTSHEISSSVLFIYIHKIILSVSLLYEAVDRIDLASNIINFSLKTVDND